MPKLKLPAICIFMVLFMPVSIFARPSYQKVSNGVIVRFDDAAPGKLRAIKLEVVSPKIIRVVASPTDAFSTVASLMVLPYNTTTSWTINSTTDSLRLNTSELVVMVSLKTGALHFKRKSGKSILKELGTGGKFFAPITVEGRDLYQLSQHFESPKDEAFYGLGQHQEGLMNYKGESITLLQYNSDIAMPFMVSSKQYGILWDNYSISRFGDCREYQNIDNLKLFDADGKAGALTATYKNQVNPSKTVIRRDEQIHYPFLDNMASVPDGYEMGTGPITWEGKMASDFTGMHRWHIYSGGYVKMWIDGKLQADVWRQSWNAASTKFNYWLEKGRKYDVKLEWIPDGNQSYCSLKWLSPIPEKKINQYGFSSEAGHEIDYYFVAGENMDELISGYRQLTGKVPMVPKWAMGFWQSRERYKTQDELMDAVKEFRRRRIGLDNIVLDWSYWKEDQWGSHEFDAKRFPDPDGMVRDLHQKYHAKIMISVWPKFYPNTAHYKELDQKGFLYKKNIELDRKDWIGAGYANTFYDAYNPEARAVFWKQVHDKLYKKGFDAWWMDATEPDIHSNLNVEDRKAIMTPNYLGSSTQYFNAFGLQNAKGVYEGLMQADSNKRVFILTRSGYGGMQRYGAAAWSGDIGTTWLDMRNQISAGLNYSLSGLPYWTHDIGGFSVEKRFEKPTSPDLEEWRELNARWYQFGAFSPLFRAHGQFPVREIFNLAPEEHAAYKTMLYYNQLRYRLMPYIYSLSGMAHLKDYTLMRGLPMDFPTDAKVRNINDQYLFGPAFLVNPVYTYKATQRKLYLPAGKGWYHAHTGVFYKGGQTINADAPYSQMPLYIKAGSIVPFGPDLQYTSEKPADTIRLMVYTGADGNFTLYEDEGQDNEYTRGQYATIHFNYQHASKTLTIGSRKGSFKNMLQSRVFEIVWVGRNKPRSIDDRLAPDKTIIYSGKTILIKQNFP